MNSFISDVFEKLAQSLEDWLGRIRSLLFTCWEIHTAVWLVLSGDSLDDYVLHGIDNMDARFDQPLNFPAQDTNSLIADTDSITPPFCDDDHLPFFDIDYSLPSPSFARSPDLQCAVNSFLAHSSKLFPWIKLNGDGRCYLVFSDGSLLGGSLTD
ncbi:hypothetical protein P3S67_006196 [Capsicum chacoense]